MPLRMMRLLLAVCVAVSGMPADAWRSPALALQTQSKSSGGGCGCPSIKPVAEPGKPTPGRVYGEHTLVDFEHFMSNRENAYGGDWDKAMVAFAHELDPGGAMGIWKKPAPQKTHNETPIEGGFSGFLKNGEPPLFDAHNHMPDARRFLTSPENLMAWSLDTIVRVDKYGEPSPGLYKAAMRIARFLADDLSNVPAEMAFPKGGQAGGGFVAPSMPTLTFPPAPAPSTPPSSMLYPSAPQPSAPQLPAPHPLSPPRSFTMPPPHAASTTNSRPQPRAGSGLSANALQDSKPKRLFQSAAAARRILIDAIGDAALGLGDPSFHKAWANAASKDTLPVDEFDRANAALDIIYSLDQNGNPQGLLSDAQTTDVPMLVAVLAGLASARHEFGGPAPAGSAADAVACKAFSILVKLSDFNRKNSDQYREALFHLVTAVNSYPSGKFNYYGFPFDAARAAYLAAGVKTDEDARKIVEITMSIALGVYGGNYTDSSNQANFPGYKGESPEVQAQGIKNANKHIATLRDFESYAEGPGQAAFQGMIQARIDDLKNREEHGLGDQSESALLKVMQAGGPDMSPAQVSDLCIIETNAAPKVFLLAKGAFHPFFVKKLYMGVPLMVGVYFDEPYTGGTYPVSVDTGGGRIQLTARPIDDEHRVFQTDTFVVGSKSNGSTHR